MFDWEEGDRFSFEDSDRFEEDSLCSWISEPESLCNNWRGWKKSNGDRTSSQTAAAAAAAVAAGLHPARSREDGQVMSLVELAAKEVACHIPFEVVEHVYPPVPEQLQLRIACWSFPENEEDIRLYSCLANGSADEFTRGEHLFKAKAVKDPLQIGFHLSATVVTPPTVPQNKGTYNVAVTFDRRRVTSCNCTCSTNSWCCHVVSVCLHRIHQSNQVCLRAPVSESLSRLHRDQLQKFAQYLISELPQQILPTAQRLLDELLSCQQSAMNTVCGAPDPTAGASANEQTTWCLDEATLHDNIRKILIKFCVPSPIVFSDVNYLSSTAPPAAAEWSSLLRPLRGREPEGMWNLLSIVREMYRRHDRNAVPLLEILTEECLSCEQILVWWFNTKVLLHSGNNGHCGRGGINSNTHASQHACASLCDEIVVLWRHAALNPALSPQERGILSNRLKDWHLKTIEKVCKARGGTSNGGNGVRKSDIEIFSGFKLAIEACLLDWEDYPIQGVTYSEGVSRRYYLPYCSNSKSQDTHSREVSSSSVAISGEQLPSSCTSVAPNIKLSRSAGITHNHSERRGLLSPHYSREVRIVTAPQTPAVNNLTTDGNRSSISSEGFCENEPECGGGSHDSDSIDDFNGNSAFQNGEQANRLLAPNSSMLPGLSMSSLAIAGKSEVSLSVNELVQNKHLIEINNSSSANGGNLTPIAKTIGSVGRALSQLAPSTSGRQFGEKDKSSPDDQDSDWSSAAENGTKATSSRMSELRDPVVKFEHSESQQSSDEYQVYYYDTKAKVPAQERPKERKLEDNNVFAGIKRMEDPLEILFARAEALHVHGHTREACKLGVKLAEEMLSNPPDLLPELPPQPTKGKRKKKVNPASHQISCLASAVLAKAAFLCTVLSENPDHYHLAFKVGMFGLEMARPPASTKVLEVKLANQESDLVALLKRIPLSPLEMKVIREKTEMLRDGKLTSRGDALLPLNLASFAVDVLCPSNASGRAIVQPGCRLPTDEELGFEAAVAAMGLKANVSEADHPLLCEGTRRQRGDLALTLLVHYKDDQEKLAKIMEKLLDKEIHQMYKVPNLSTYYSSSKIMPAHSVSNKFGINHKDNSAPGPSDDFRKQLGASGSNNNSGAAGGSGYSEEGLIQDIDRTISGINLNGLRGNPLVSESRSKETLGHQNRCSDDRRDDTSSPTWEEDYKAWEAKFRCTNFRTHKKHSAGMASIDSSAPETTSSDNSPTLIRRSGWNKPVGPGSDSGSSGKSSDSFGSSSSGDKTNRNKGRENESPQPLFPSVRCHKLLGGDMITRSVTPCVKNTRFKGKRSYPSVPNQPSEASAHFMFELAKTVLTKAGGNSSTSLFTQPSTNQNHRGPHRALHMCAFQIGLYALGLHNCVSPNWLSRTYSSHVSWIASQALEIGSAAVTFLIDTWEGHLTPPEVASLADRASRGRDPNMVGTAAELALSCLPHAHALNPNEIQRAIMQCKEQNNEMLERACLAVESAAKGGGVYPEVLFDVARRWYELYKDTLPGTDRAQGSDSNSSSAHVTDAQQGMAAGASTSSDLGLMLGSSVTTSSASISMDVNSGIGVSVDSMGFGPSLGSDVQIPLTILNHVPVTSVGGVAVTVAHSIPYSVPPLNNTVVGMPFAPALPYNYLPSFTSPYSQPHLSLQSPIPLHPYIAAQFPYANQAAFSLPTQAYYPIPAVTVASQIRAPAPPPPPVYVGQLSAAQNGQQQRPGLLLTSQNPMHCMGPQGNGHPSQSAPPQARGSISSISQAQLNYLLSTYRVGMLALETLARRVHDDRPNAKYARTPPYGEDVKWLLNVAKKLGASYVQQFCLCIVNSVVSPFLLQEIILEAALYLAKNNPGLVVQHFRSPVLTPLVQKCQQMYIQCTHLKMYHLTPAEYEEFVGIIRSARNAFQMTPGGMVQFNEFLQALRRSKTCKKDLWQRIASGLQAGNV